MKDNGILWSLVGLAVICFLLMLDAAGSQPAELSMRYDLTSVHPAGLLIHDRKTDTVYFCGKNLVNDCRPWANLRELIP